MARLGVRDFVVNGFPLVGDDFVYSDMLSTSGADVKSPHGRDTARAAHAREIIGQVKLA